MSGGTRQGVCRGEIARVACSLTIEIRIGENSGTPLLNIPELTGPEGGGKSLCGLT